MPDEFAEVSALDDLRRANRQLQRQLRDAKARVQDLVDATISAAHDAALTAGPIPSVPVPKPDRRKRAGEAAIVHATDWQGRKVTPTYDGDVMEKRVRRFCEKAERLIEIQRADHPVDDLVIAFGGDMGEGLFNFPTQPFEIDASIFEQFVSVAELEAQVVRWGLSVAQRVQVVCEWGNHGRIGSKRSAVPRSDNFDRMTYELARRIVGKESRLTWQGGEEDIQHIEVGNYRALLIHGDEIGRNGFASRNTIVQHVNRWRSGAHRWEFRDVYCGHYHVHGEEGLANGEGSVYWTGSTESTNRYASDTLASSAIPSQRVNFVDLEAGRVSAAYKVWLE